MKKSLIYTTCLLFFCGGLFVLHLAAQSENTPVEEQYPLLNPKMEQCSERELLELKIKSCQKSLDFRDTAVQAGSPEGRTALVCDARAELADAEAELYRYINDKVKLQKALKTKVEAYREKLKSLEMSYRAGFGNSVERTTAEIQLLDALLEKKRSHE